MNFGARASLFSFLKALSALFGGSSRQKSGYRPHASVTHVQPQQLRPVRHETVLRPVPPAVPPVVHGHCFVIDGDTIVISGTHIRLAGIDAPEIDQPYGVKAKWALVGLCKGMAVRAEGVARDDHGRVVARCYLPDGRDLAAEMVRLGQAVDWPKYSGGRYRHLEVPGVRKRLWRCDARQKGRMPPAK